MEDCVFCKIVRGEVPAQKVTEDERFLAFLGVFPKFPGMTVVASKKHIGSYLYRSLDDETFSKMHLFAKKVALAIDKALGSSRCVQIMEGLEVDHAHLKLFPLYVGRMYDVSYEGTQKASDTELAEVAEKIRKVVL